MQQKATIGIIGGSGLYHMAGFESQEEILLETPFGQPSDAYIVGTLEGKSVAFLARHGRGHRIQPSDLNFRANIYGLKMLGVERILSVSAVGSLKEEHKPWNLSFRINFSIGPPAANRHSSAMEWWRTFLWPIRSVRS